MVIFQYNLYIFGIHLWTVLYPKPCYNEPCYKEVELYLLFVHKIQELCRMQRWTDCINAGWHWSVLSSLQKAGFHTLCSFLGYYMIWSFKFISESPYSRNNKKTFPTLSFCDLLLFPPSGQTSPVPFGIFCILEEITNIISYKILKILLKNVQQRTC